MDFMTTSRRFALALAAGALLAGCSAEAPVATDQPADPSSTVASSAPASSPSPARGGSSSVVPGAYVTWAEYDADPAAYRGSTVVLFFHASWCPDCQATEASLDAEGVPEGLTVVKVDFDAATELRQRYGVTVQHTFVQLGSGDDPEKRWTGSVSGADIAAQLV